MTKPRASKKVGVLFLLLATTAVASTAQTFTILLGFDGPDGATPFLVGPIQGTDGNLYGTTFYYGPKAHGTIFKLTRENTHPTFYSFCQLPHCSDGAHPASGLVQTTDGTFYGTTFYGGRNLTGTIFRITLAGSLTTLYTFCSRTQCSDGYGPAGALIQAVDGSFYGTTNEGGGASCMGGCGTIFKFTSTGHLTTLHTFDSADGASPFDSLIQAIDGNFYGTTAYGGIGNFGTVFKLTPCGAFTTLHFFDSVDGAGPQGNLLQASDGNLYGTAGFGGNSNCLDGCGTVFKISTAGAFTTLYTFCSQANCPDGAYPVAGLIEGSDGNFYGTTYAGGSSNGAACTSQGCGTVFMLTPAGVLTTLHVFGGSPNDGASPEGNLLQATDGNFYGTTFWGGAADYGTVFKLSTGLGPFVSFLRATGKIGQTGGILGQGFTGTTSVSLNGTPASFKVVSDTFIKATVPAGATTGYVTVTTPSGTLTSNVPFHVLP